MMPGRASPRFVAAVGLSVAWIAFDALAIAHGQSLASLGLFFRGTWGTGEGIGAVLRAASALLLAGVAVHVALRAGLFNAGADGQIAVGCAAASAVASRLPPAWSGGAVLATASIAAAAAGAAWAAVPAVLRVRYRAHEAITTILMNRVAAAVAMAALARGVVAPAASAHLAPLHAAAAGVALPLVAIGAVLAVASVERWTRIGREMGLVGMGREACAAERIPVGARLLQAMLASGAIAALSSGVIVAGAAGPFAPGVEPGAGFGGIAVALVGGGRAVGLVLAALLFGTLARGGVAMGAVVPGAMMDVLQAVVIVAVAFVDARPRGALAEPA